jgi:hypothetical protein
MTCMSTAGLTRASHKRHRTDGVHCAGSECFRLMHVGAPLIGALVHNYDETDLEMWLVQISRRIVSLSLSPVLAFLAKKMM